MATRAPLGEEQKGQIRRLYFETDTYVRVIAATFGLSERALYSCMDDWGWERVRADRRLRQAEERALAKKEERSNPPPPASETASSGPGGPVDFAALAQAVGHRAAAELDRLGDELAAGRADARGAASTLASLTRSLAAAQDLARKAADLAKESATRHDATQDEPPARSLDELHDELARALDRIVAEETAAGRDDFLQIVRSLPLD